MMSLISSRVEHNRCYLKILEGLNRLIASHIDVQHFNLYIKTKTDYSF